jgi:hypothetical protein
MSIVDIVAWSITGIVIWEAFKLLIRNIIKKKEKKRHEEYWHANDVY